MKLKVKEIYEELLKTKSMVSDILLATADFGVEEGGKPKHTRYSHQDIDYVDSLTKEIRSDLLFIRNRCVSGFESRNNGHILSKFGAKRGKARS